MQIYGCPFCGTPFGADPSLTHLASCPQCRNTVDLRTATAPKSSAVQSTGVIPIKTTKSLNLGTTIAACLLFFLPWLEMKCAMGPSMVAQSGFQAIIGDASVSSEAVSKSPSSSQNSKGLRTIAFFVAIAFLAAIAAAVVSALDFSESQSRFGTLIAILSFVATGAIFLQMIVGFPLRSLIRQELDEDVRGMIGIFFTPWFFLEMLLLVTPGVLWIVNRYGRPPPG